MSQTSVLANPVSAALQAPLAADLERRFGGLRRLYGDAAYARLRSLRIGVVGLGGVGSWAAEALARSGVAELVLIDMDHIAESNINRQVQAVGRSVGQAKGLALQARIADIHPGCRVHWVDDFVSPDNWPQILPTGLDAIIDACDQTPAKLAMAVWALQQRQKLVVVGAAGGKRLPQRIEAADLALATHDPLLAALRQRLRRDHGAARQGDIGLGCVFSKESVQQPQNLQNSQSIEAPPCAVDAAGNAMAPAPIVAPIINAQATDGGLNCHGYGSSVMVTASFGMTAAASAVEACLSGV